MLSSLHRSCGVTLKIAALKRCNQQNKFKWRMKIKIENVVNISIILLFSANSHAQDSINHHTVFPTSISIEYGMGNYSVKDEYISKEKYSGTLPGIKINWLRFHDKYGYHFSLEYGGSSNIENYNVSTTIYQFALNQGFLYPLPEFSLFSRAAYAFLGPSTELLFFYNNQNIAVSGFDYAQSLALLFSGGLNSLIILPLGNKLQVEGAVSMSILSLGFRLVDSEEEDVSPVNLLTFLSGTNAAFSLGLSYNLLDNFSTKLAYELHVTRISAWDPLLSASDNINISLAYKF